MIISSCRTGPFLRKHADLYYKNKAGIYSILSILGDRRQIRTIVPRKIIVIWGKISHVSGMKKLFLIPVISLGGLLQAHANEDLPEKSKALLKSYKDYENRKIKAYNEDMLKVKKKVVAGLKKHLQEATQKSNLDASQAVIEKIKDFENQVKTLEQQLNSKVESAPPKSSLSAKKKTFKLEGTGERWQSTRLRVEKGETVSVKVTGVIGLSTLFKDVKSDGNGIGIKQHGHDNSFSLGILLGRVHSDAGKLFELGKNGSFKVEKTGTLELSVNDKHTGDNTGAWDIEISIK